MTVRLVDPSGAAAAGAVVELTDREAAEVIIVAQTEAGDALYDLGRLAAAVTELLKVVDDLTAVTDKAPTPETMRLLTGRLKAVLASVRGDRTTELDRRTGYPEIPAIGALLDMAHDSEVYLEHVRAHVRHSADDARLVDLDDYQRVALEHIADLAADLAGRSLTNLLVTLEAEVTITVNDEPVTVQLPATAVDEVPT